MNNHNIILILLFGLGMNSCLTDTPAYEKLTDNIHEGQVFIARAQDNINYIKIYSIEEDEFVEPGSMKINVGLGTVGLPSKDIKISLVENEFVRDSINELRELEGEKPYLPFPKDTYEIDLFELTIKSGKVYSNYSTISYFPDKFDL